jgi:hypothetical protein
VKFPERAAAISKPEARHKHPEIDDRGGEAGAEQLQPRQSQLAMDQDIDQHGIGRDRGDRDPQSRLRPVDRAHEAADREKPQRRRNAPRQAQQIILREMRGRGSLAQHQQDLLARQSKRQHRQGNQQRSPKADAKRAPHQAWIAGAERLSGERRHGRHQPHSEGETDEGDRMRQRRRGNGFIPETSDQGKIGGHHRDLPELRQRDGHSQLERLGQLERELTAGRCRHMRRGDRFSLDFFKGCHGVRLSPPPIKNGGRHSASPFLLERDDFSSNRHPAPSFCLSMISGQTLRVRPEGKPVPTLGSSPRACFSGSCSRRA